MDNNEQKSTWTLSYGCWKGTITSRDCGADEFESLQACKNFLAQQEAFWKRIGYYKWFATAIGPNGENVTL